MLELIRTSASPEPSTTSFDTHTVMLECVATSFADEAATTDISLQLETAGQWWRLTHFFSNRQASDTTGPILGAIDSVYLRGTAIWVYVKAQQYRSVLPTPTDNIQPRTRLRKILVAAWRSKRSSKFGSSHRLAVSKVQTTIPPPRPSKGSNGRVERVHASVQGTKTAIHCDVERMYSTKIPLSRPAVPWKVRHDGWLPRQMRSGPH